MGVTDAELAGAYAEPEQDDDVEAGGDDDELETPAVWYRLPLWRLWLFSLLGGWWYQIHWMYSSWRAYRASLGYSRQVKWRAIHAQTGALPSPFWRALLLVYSYNLLLTIRREARLAGVSGFGEPALWFGLQLVAGSLPAFRVSAPWIQLLLSIIFLPAQATVNRIADRQSGERRREPISVGELLSVAVGLLLIVTTGLASR